MKTTRLELRIDQETKDLLRQLSAAWSKENGFPVSDSAYVRFLIIQESRKKPSS